MATNPVASAIPAANSVGAISASGSWTSRPTGISASVRIGTPEHSSQVSSRRGPIPSERASGGACGASASAKAGRISHSIARYTAAVAVALASSVATVTSSANERDTVSSAAPNTRIATSQRTAVSRA